MNRRARRAPGPRAQRPDQNQGLRIFPRVLRWRRAAAGGRARAGSWAQGMRQSETRVSMNLVAADVSRLISERGLPRPRVDFLLPYRAALEGRAPFRGLS